MLLYQFLARSTMQPLYDPGDASPGLLPRQHPGTISGIETPAAPDLAQHVDNPVMASVRSHGISILKNRHALPTRKTVLSCHCWLRPWPQAPSSQSCCCHRPPNSSGSSIIEKKKNVWTCVEHCMWNLPSRRQHRTEHDMKSPSRIYWTKSGRHRLRELPPVPATTLQANKGLILAPLQLKWRSVKCRVGRSVTVLGRKHIFRNYCKSISHCCTLASRAPSMYLIFCTLVIGTNLQNRDWWHPIFLWSLGEPRGAPNYVGNLSRHHSIRI